VLETQKINTVPIPLGLFVNSVFKVGFTTAPVYQNLDTAMLDGVLVTVKGVTG
jgi:hypothetical protein